MAARHEALARDILEIHADFFMAVYGYRKTHARSSARGRDPAEIGRDQVMNVMRESGIRGVRRGRTPVTTKPAKGTGGRPDLVERGFEAEAPNRPHVADITYVRMANGSFGHTAFATDVFARRIVGRTRATTMDTRKLSLQALEQAISLGRLAWRHGRSRAPFRPWRAVHQPRVHHQDRGIRHASLDRHGRRLVRQRHGRERRRRVQDRARLATQALPGFEGPGTGDVPVGLVAGTRSVCTSPWATGHRNGPKPSIMQTKRRKPPHYKGGTKIRPYHKTSNIKVCQTIDVNNVITQKPWHMILAEETNDKARNPGKIDTIEMHDGTINTLYVSSSKEINISHKGKGRIFHLHVPENFTFNHQGEITKYQDSH